MNGHHFERTLKLNIKSGEHVPEQISAGSDPTLFRFWISLCFYLSPAQLATFRKYLVQFYLSYG